MMSLFKTEFYLIIEYVLLFDVILFFVDMTFEAKWVVSKQQ